MIFKQPSGTRAAWLLGHFRCVKELQDDARSKVYTNLLFQTCMLFPHWMAIQDFGVVPFLEKNAFRFWAIWYRRHWLLTCWAFRIFHCTFLVIIALYPNLSQMVQSTIAVTTDFPPWEAPNHWQLNSVNWCNLVESLNEDKSDAFWVTLLVTGSQHLPTPWCCTNDDNQWLNNVLRIACFSTCAV